MIKISYPLFKSILMVCILQYMIGCGNSVDDLTNAAHLGNIETVKQILSDNPELINQKDSKNETALYWAIRYGQIDVVKELLSRDADISIQTSLLGNTPLVEIIRENSYLDEVLNDGSTKRLKILEILLEADKKLPEEQRTIRVKVSQSTVSYNGYTPLIAAITISNPAINQVLNDGSTPRLKIIQMLLKADEQLSKDKRTIQVTDFKSKTPLLKAISTFNNLEQDLGGGKTQRLKIVEMLLEADATLINITAPDGKTPLDRAYERNRGENNFGYDRIIKILKDNDAKTSAELKENN